MVMTYIVVACIVMVYAPMAVGADKLSKSVQRHMHMVVSAVIDLDVCVGIRADQ